MTNIFPSQKPKSYSAGTVVGIIVLYAIVFTALAWAITLAVTEIVTNGVSFWPTLTLVITAWVVLGWVGKK